MSTLHMFLLKSVEDLVHVNVICDLQSFQEFHGRRMQASRVIRGFSVLLVTFSSELRSFYFWASSRTVKASSYSLRHHSDPLNL